MFIGGFDIGTTGCKLTVYDEKGNQIHTEYLEYEVSRQNGKHEIRAETIFDAVLQVLKKTVAVCGDIAAIGVTSFGESFVALDENDRVLLPSMLYTDPRGSVEAEELAARLGEDTITHIAGVRPHSMYSIPKIMWIKKNKPEIYAKIKRILLMEDYVVYMLTGIAQIDLSLAARTLGLDIRNKCWSREIFEAAGIDSGLMSKPVKTGTVAGDLLPHIAAQCGVTHPMKIVSACHDQVASALGSGVFEVGSAADGMGTVECVVPVFDKIPENMQIYDEGYAVVPYVFDNTYVCYALSFTCGAVLKWYRDNFARYEKQLTEETGGNIYAMLDSRIPEKPTDILILPHFAGAANPYMDSQSRAAIVGLTLEHTGYDLYKALMEGVTYEISTNIEHLKAAGIELDRLIATGGGAASDVWLQLKADILSREIKTVRAKEVGACGTCMLTGVAIGAFDSLQAARDVFVKEAKSFLPNGEKSSQYAKNYAAFKKLYAAVRPIVKEVEHE